MRIRIIAILLGSFLILGPNDMFGQKTKGAKNKALDLEQVEKEIQAVMEIYQPYAEKYMNELKKMKNFDEMVHNWEEVILEENPSKKTSKKELFQAKYNEKLVAAIAKSGIAGPVFKGQIKKVLKSLDFDIDRNSGTLMMHRNFESALAPAYVGNCDVRHEFTLTKTEDKERILNDGLYVAQGNIGTDDAKIFAASEYGSHQIVRNYYFEYSGVTDACRYRLEANGNYNASMVYYANLCPVTCELITEIKVTGSSDELLYIKDDILAPVILPFHTSEDNIGSIEPMYDEKFDINMDFNPNQKYRCDFTVRTAAFRPVCSLVGNPITNGFVHSYAETNFLKNLSIVYFTYSY